MSAASARPQAAKLAPFRTPQILFRVFHLELETSDALLVLVGENRPCAAAHLADESDLAFFRVVARVRKRLFRGLDPRARRIRTAAGGRRFSVLRLLRPRLPRRAPPP